MPDSVTHYPLILASSSPYRKALLSRLQLSFISEAPEIDESHHAGETPEDLVTRLARTKADRIAQAHGEPAVIIGSDQVVALHTQILTKPLTHENAKAQLASLSGQCVVFSTGLCVLNTALRTYQTDCILFQVTFRDLDSATIDRYLEAEQPYDCAGSFKSEGLGISLMRETAGTDATALVGLPLIRLSEMLRQEGFVLP